MLQVTLFGSEAEAQGARLELPGFDALVEMLSEVVVSPEKLGQRGWSPAVFRDNRRRKTAVESISCLVLDIDTPNLPESLDGAGLSWFAHRTFSGHWRLVIELSRPYQAAEHSRLRRAVMADFDINETLGPDKAADASRFYFGPCVPDASMFETRRSRGGVLDVDAYLRTIIPEVVPEVAAPERPEAPVTASPSVTGASLFRGALDLSPILDASTKRSVKESSRRVLRDIFAGVFTPKQGERDVALHHAASCLASLVEPAQSEEWALGVAQGIFDRMGDDLQPEGLEHWREKFLSSWRRSMERRRAVEERKAAFEAALFPSKPSAAPVSTPEPAVQAGTDDDGWKEQLLRRETKSGVMLMPVGRNIELILRHDKRVNDLWWNSLDATPVWRSGPLSTCHPDNLDTALSNWLVQSDYRLQVSRGDCAANLYLVSRSKIFDPVAEWLRSLKWDGVPRAYRMLMHYFQLAEGNAHYWQVIAEKWLIGAVARALKPGCQMDTTLLLADNGEGGQGKTSFCRIMGGQWYGKVDTHLDKEALQKVTGKWVVELAEMAVGKRTDRERMRGFLTDTVDRFRPPYGRIVQEFPRRCVFVGTSNDDTPIQDAFGKRRYWPVRVERELLRDELERDRAQLFAEAVVLFDEGEKWWLTKEEEEIANEERGLMLEVDAFAETVMEWVRGLEPEKRPQYINVPEFLKVKFSMMPHEVSKMQKGAALALRQAGFGKVRTSKGTVWAVPPKLLHWGLNRAAVLARPEEGSDKEKSE